RMSFNLSTWSVLDSIYLIFCDNVNELLDRSLKANAILYLQYPFEAAVATRPVCRNCRAMFFVTSCIRPTGAYAAGCGAPRCPGAADQDTPGVNQRHAAATFAKRCRVYAGYDNAPRAGC